MWLCMRGSGSPQRESLSIGYVWSAGNSYSFVSGICRYCGAMDEVEDQDIDYSSYTMNDGGMFELIDTFRFFWLFKLCTALELDGRWSLSHARC
jgi:hypothetical protein